MVFKKHLELEDVKIHGVDIPEDTLRAGYNIGDLLNMPYLSGQWDVNMPGLRERLQVVGRAYQGSVLDIYRMKMGDTNLPCPPLIVESVKDFISRNKERFEVVRPIVQDPACVCVHVRSGDQLVGYRYCDLIGSLSSRFDVVVLLSGVHLDESCKNNRDKIQNFATSINGILSRNTNIYICLDEPDVHLGLMMLSSNLLVHKGGFSALGSVVSTGNLFVTGDFNHGFHDNWKAAVDKPALLLD